MATKQELAAALAVAQEQLEALANTASVNAITNAAPLAPISPDDRLYNAACATVDADDELRLAFIAAGGDQDKPKGILMSGRIAKSLGLTREGALLVMGKQGRGKRSPTENLSDKFRTVEEEKACGAARGFLSARLKAWGIKTSSTQGGDRTVDDDTCDATPFEKLKKPKVETAIEFGAFMLAHVGALYDFCQVNKAHPALASDGAANIMGALADCLDVIKAAQSKNA